MGTLTLHEDLQTIEAAAAAARVALAANRSAHRPTCVCTACCKVSAVIFGAQLGEAAAWCRELLASFDELDVTERAATLEEVGARG